MEVAMKCHAIVASALIILAINGCDADSKEINELRSEIEYLKIQAQTERTNRDSRAIQDVELSEALSSRQNEIESLREKNSRLKQENEALKKTIASQKR